MKEFSDMLEEVSRSIANDGEIEPVEAKRNPRHWEALKREAGTFVVSSESGIFSTADLPTGFFPVWTCSHGVSAL